MTLRKVDRKRLLSICVIGLLTCVSCVPEVPKDSSLEIVFTGDVLLDRGVRTVLKDEGLDSVFAGVTELFRKADAVVVNLECPLTDTVSQLNKKYIFRADAVCAEGLKRVGVTHAAMANNHTNDQGRRGLVSTYRHLTEAGIIPLGYGWDADEQLTPAVIRKDGVEVAVFNSVFVPLENWHYLVDRPGVCQASCEDLADAVRRYKSSHEDSWVVVVLHWGTEFDSHPTLRQRMQARMLADAGTDVLIGHHPHVVQDTDVIKSEGAGMCDSTLVYYSLGNFVFDQTAPGTGDALMVRLRFNADGTLTRESLPVAIKDSKPTLRTTP